MDYENFGFTEIQLTTNKFSYTQSFTQSFATTLGSHVEKFSSDLSFFNIDYYIKDKKLYADLVYPSNYADVKFLVGTNSINVTNKINIYEKNVEIQETLKPEVNKNFCQNFISTPTTAKYPNLSHKFSYIR